MGLVTLTIHIFPQDHTYVPYIISQRSGYFCFHIGTVPCSHPLCRGIMLLLNEPSSWKSQWKPLGHLKDLCGIPGGRNSLHRSEHLSAESSRCNVEFTRTFSAPLVQAHRGCIEKSLHVLFSFFSSSRLVKSTLGIWARSPLYRFLAPARSPKT